MVEWLSKRSSLQLLQVKAIILYLEIRTHLLKINCIIVGANVFVTSGTEGKIIKAKSLGAIAGVNYKDCNYISTLLL